MDVYIQQIKICGGEKNIKYLAGCKKYNSNTVYESVFCLVFFTQSANVSYTLITDISVCLFCFFGVFNDLFSHIVSVYYMM